MIMKIVQRKNCIERVDIVVLLLRKRKKFSFQCLTFARAIVGRNVHGY